jgi:hypothetical protein
MTARLAWQPTRGFRHVVIHACALGLTVARGAANTQAAGDCALPTEDALPAPVDMTVHEGRPDLARILEDKARAAGSIPTAVVVAGPEG